jgi:hypothetical protein
MSCLKHTKIKYFDINFEDFDDKNKKSNTCARFADEKEEETQELLNSKLFCTNILT